MFLYKFLICIKCFLPPYILIAQLNAIFTLFSVRVLFTSFLTSLNSFRLVHILYVQVNSVWRTYFCMSILTRNFIILFWRRKVGIEMMISFLVSLPYLICITQCENVLITKKFLVKPWQYEWNKTYCLFYNGWYSTMCLFSGFSML